MILHNIFVDESGYTRAEEVFVEVSRVRKGGHRELNSRTYHIVSQAVDEAIQLCPGYWE
jgi:hypothetical protein